jgi:protein-S-isoprenylcysteine O-methyltransferase Ste14
MISKKYPYIYDSIAAIFTFSILILSNFVPKGTNTYLKIVGVFILFNAGLIWVLPFIHLKKYGKVEKGQNYYETSCIVDQGIYAVVRHPQYLGYILLVMGFAFLYQNWIIVILAFMAILCFYYHTIEEEKQLIDRFQDSYLTYAQKVPRFNIISGIFSQLRS